MIYYHLTAIKNLESILTNGLQPQFGPRSRRVSPEVGDAIFVTKVIDHAIELYSLSYWSQHPDFSNGQVLLEVCTDELPICDNRFNKGLILRNPIPPQAITHIQNFP